MKLRRFHDPFSKEAHGFSRGGNWRWVKVVNVAQ